MNLDKEKLIDERTLLQKEFDQLRKEMSNVELQLGNMKSNLNALNGAIQQTNRFIDMVEGKEETKTDEKV